jgi:tripartite-type tricarboxylate transporter receptor subunit TctC
MPSRYRRSFCVTLMIGGSALGFTMQAGAATTAGADSGTASAYPARPIRVIVGFPPGSGTDGLARFIGAKLTDGLGQRIVVDNRPGANGIIAAEITANAPPDGHTLLFMSASHTMNAAVYKLPFDSLRAFTPVSLLASGPLVLVAHPSFPANDAKGLIDIAKDKPQTVTYAISGTGGINHFGGALFASMAGVQLRDVPYKGGSQAITDLIAGRVQTMFSTLTIALTQIRAGKLKALGVTGPKRSPLLPDVPTIAESGLPGYQMNTWWGVLAPAGVPRDIVNKLNSEIAEVLNQPESAKRLIGNGAEPAPMSGSEYGRLLSAEVAKWQDVAQKAKITAK